MSQSIDETILQGMVESLLVRVKLLSACTGSGAFKLAAHAVFDQLGSMCDREFEDSCMHSEVRNT